MKKTLLLVFIHGFKGGDDTFASFPSYLRVLLTHALPKISIEQVQYPKFDTRGDLLQNKVIDLEVANGTPSPTVDPSVHVVLIGHSMGGIVAAETVLSIKQDQPVSSSGMLKAEANTFMFPYVQGILAFDTPYLGIAPGVVAHGAQEHWNTASAAYGAYTSVASAFGLNAANETAKGNEQAQKVSQEASKMITSGPSSDEDAAAVPAWSKWGKYAMFAGAAGAVAAGGAAAYMKRDALTEGAKWMGSHLEFVGCLARSQELKARVDKILQLEQENSFAFANLYTCLGQAVEGKKGLASQISGPKERTFCILPEPSNKARPYFYPMINDKATAETNAHMQMFTPRDNPGYYAMSEKAKELISSWMQNTWYDEAEEEMEASFEDEAEMVERPSVDLTVDDDDMSGAEDEGFEDVKKEKVHAYVDDNPWK
ncbi:hypothetical protein E2P81_ATG06246 [Venturia nashicola]|uniref:DUF676 domain-containing protein n=1 Tax=Venturia nashicola TaxID=86259 RepID=A0A4Z1P2Z2_9PEZI|nr:hypothetical protein E6O75_ATG06391 [Venturia nashicola]TLD27900.1 hypothetical protein E2P81_ATG06246 [Venturia nashicola]